MAEVEIKTNNKSKKITAIQKENAVYHISVRWTPHQLEDKKVRGLITHNSTSCTNLFTQNLLDACRSPMKSFTIGLNHNGIEFTTPTVILRSQFHYQAKLVPHVATGHSTLAFGGLLTGQVPFIMRDDDFKAGAEADAI